MRIAKQPPDRTARICARRFGPAAHFRWAGPVCGHMQKIPGIDNARVQNCRIIMGCLCRSSAPQAGQPDAAAKAGHIGHCSVQNCLPTISSTLQECIRAGLVPIRHSVPGNQDIHPSRCLDFLASWKPSGQVAGAAVHSYFHTLCDGSGHDPFARSEIDNPLATTPFVLWAIRPARVTIWFWIREPKPPRFIPGLARRF